jgi:hypothetical protein
MLTRSIHCLSFCALALGGCAAEHAPHNEGPLPHDTVESTTESPDPVGVERAPGAPEALDTASDDKSVAMEVEAPGPAWKDTSARIHIETRNYWLGGFEYERAVEDLSEEQRALLQGLARMDSDPDYCVYDALEATVTIEDADGSVETFEMEQGICHYDGPLLTFATLRPFLRTLDCLSWGHYGGTQGAQSLPAGEAPVVRANDGCTHGLWDSPSAIMLDVTDVNLTYTIESLDCFDGPVKIDLHDGARPAVLASSQAVEDGCSTLTHQFAETGLHALRIEGHGAYSLRITAE